MMLSPRLYDSLVNWLETRPILYPARQQLAFSDDFVPAHLDCYGTARRVQQEHGYPVIAGIQFLDKHGKLFPWPHMVNATGKLLSDGLIDASPKVDQPRLGFVPIGLNETQAWNDITTAYASADAHNASGSSWGCDRADELTTLYFDKLRFRAGFMKVASSSIQIPASMPKLSQLS